MEADRKTAEETAQRIIHQVESLSEHRQRCYAFSNKLVRMKEEMIAEIFQVIAEGARHKKPVFQAGYRIISDISMLSHYLGPEEARGGLFHRAR